MQPRQTSRADRWPIELLAAALLAGAVWIVYLVALDAPLIFDDTLSIEQNKSITRLWPLVGNQEHPGPLRPPVEHPISARPLVNLSFALNYHFSKLDPRGFRLFNLALHFTNAMLLWIVVRRTLRLPYFAGRFAASAGPLAFAVALVWAVHPLLTETVVYVTQRTELMVAWCYLTTLYSSMRYWSAATPTARWGWLAAATLACFAGAASREVMISAPLVVLLFERTFVSGTFRECLRRSWPLYVGLIASWLLIFALQWDTPRSKSAGFGLDIPLVDWWSTQARVFWMYLKLAVYPWPLLIHYEMSLQSLAANWPYVLAAAALGVATAVLVWRRQPAGFLLACDYLILAPTHLVPIPTEMAAERRMYLPLAALVALLVTGVFVSIRAIAERSSTDPKSFFRGRRLIGVGVVVVLIFALVYALASSQRVGMYREPIALWEDVVARQPGSYVAQHGLATELAAVRRTAEAIEHYRAAVRAKPDYARAQYGLGLALAQTGQYDESVVHLREVVRLKPDAYKLRNNLGVVLFTGGRYSEAIVEFEKTLALRPDFVEAQENLNRARQASVLPKRAE
jgi:tetratricopeptide (TPR) repeat protein